MKISNHMSVVWIIGFVFTMFSTYVLKRDVLYTGAMGFGLYVLLLAVKMQNDIEQQQ